MSTKMYLYRIPKDRWKDFTLVCRGAYLNNHPLMQLLKFVDDHGDSPLDSFKQVSETISALDHADMTVDLQVFDEGDAYIIHPLERGYFFINNAREWGEFLDEFTCDNFTDVPLEEKNKVVAQWCDDKVSRNEYFTFNALSRDDFLEFRLGVLSLSR